MVTISAAWLDEDKQRPALEKLRCVKPPPSQRDTGLRKTTDIVGCVNAPGIMSTSVFTFAVLTMLAGVLTAGCGPDCESLCEDAKDCDWGTARKTLACTGMCKAIEREAERRGCDDEHDDVMSCYADQDDVCAQSNDGACALESSFYTRCMVHYCDTHPDDSGCG